MREHEAAQQRQLEQAQRLAEAERQRAADQARSAVRLRWLVRGLGLVAMFAVAASVFAWVARQLARINADVAVEKADEAQQQTAAALNAQKETQQALTQVAAADDLRGFEWHYLKKLMDSRAAVYRSFDKPIKQSVVTPDG